MTYFFLLVYLYQEGLSFSHFVMTVIVSTMALLLSWVSLGVFVPMVWLSFEKALWSRCLGDSPAGKLVQGFAEKDFKLQIKRFERDKGLPRNLASLFAVISRIKHFLFHGLRREMESLKNEMLVLDIKDLVSQLNKGWTEGNPPEILNEYMEAIRKSSEDPYLGDEQEKLEALCSVAIAQYALGDMKGGNELGKSNWNRAQSLENEDDSILKWLASYGYFNSNVLLGKFVKSMEMMGKQWAGYFKGRTDEEKTRLKCKVANKLILNPILALPRHLILAAALNDSPKYDEIYWPNSDSYNEWIKKGPEKKACDWEIQWIDAWYREAVQICDAHFDSTGISLNFSRAYTAFYYTLLLQDVDADTRAELVNAITGIFGQIDDRAPIPSLYVKYGFLGIFHLANNQNSQKAFDNFQQAAKYSAVSGNSFADCIFNCGHAIAAEHLCKNQSLAPYVKHYLQKAKNLANEKLGGCFYPFLFEGAYAAICEIRGEEGEAAVHKANGSRGKGGKRILNIFQNNCLSR